MLISENSEEFIYVGDGVSAGVGCEAAAIVRTGCALTKFMECGNVCKEVPLKLKQAVYKT